jgi:hypothetical protein
MSEQNRETRTAWQFHNATKYTLIGQGGDDRQILMGEPPNLGPAIGEQDPAIEPFPYKIYTSLDPIPLPREPFASPVRALAAPVGPTTTLRPLDEAAAPDETIVDVIQRRRSNRHYAAETPVSFAAFSTVLDRAMRGKAIDCLDPGAPPLHDAYLIVNNVEGLEPGTYLLRPDRGGVELLAAGDRRATAAATETTASSRYLQPTAPEGETSA